MAARLNASRWVAQSSRETYERDILTLTTIDHNEQSMQVDQLLFFINTQHTTHLRLLHRYDVGEWGAFSVEDQHHRRFVLKWGDNGDLIARIQRAIQITDRLRTCGWPIPQYVLVGQTSDGTAYSLQEEVPGRPREQLTAVHIKRLIALNELQQGQAISGEQNWSSYVHDTVFKDVSGWQTTLQNYSKGTAAILHDIRTLTAGTEQQALPLRDIVHSDFTTDNILFDKGDITAIIDWDAAGCGDRLLDLAKLLFTEHNNEIVRGTVYTYLIAYAGIERLRIYIAHFIFGQLDWSIRHHPPTDIERWITTAQFFIQYLARSR